MTEAVVQRAVSWWRHRHGSMAAFDGDDAAQEARIGLWQASTDLQAVAYRRIVDAVRALHPGYQGRKPLFDPHATYENWRDVADEAPGPEDLAAWNERVRLLAASLSDRDQRIVSDVMAGKTLRAIAAEEGHHESAISLRLTRVVNLLAEADQPRAARCAEMSK